MLSLESAHFHISNGVAADSSTGSLTEVWNTSAALFCVCQIILLREGEETLVS